MKFKLHSDYQPAGDQPKAIEQLVDGLEKNLKRQTLLGVTGSGKTFTIANVIERVQKPTLVIAHNKTLAAQLCNEFREFFPKNAVEYFVSYYDYYQPEAYMPNSDTYIEKEAMINEEIDRLRHACTQALLTRDDTIIVASVSAIYGLGSPFEYEKIVLHLRKGQELDRRAMLEQLIAMQFERTNSELKCGSFRMRGQVFEIMPVNEDAIYRFEISARITQIELIDSITRIVKREVEDVWLFPARHYVVGEEGRKQAFDRINNELQNQLALFEKQGKVLEYERLKRRVAYDLQMIKNVGYCNGIENYSRHFEGRTEGEPPFTLLDYFLHRTQRTANPTQPPLGKGRGTFLTVIDESHVTLPQIRSMYNGDKARKDTLVEHGFRLPSARDNRPLTYTEFDSKIGQAVYVSATPSEYEMKVSEQIVEQIVRPTGLIDPEVIVRPIVGRARPLSGSLLCEGERDVEPSPPQRRGQGEVSLSQIEDLILRIEERVKNNERVLVTTLTKKMAEDLTEHLKEKNLKVAYLHSDVSTLDRIEVIMNLRLGKNDVIVGVNLLREGLDMPEVSLVAILDADKEGFLRSETSLIQTIGRAARNVNGQVVLYADNITGSMKRAIEETNRRREIQMAYNKEHGITPKTIQKAIRNILEEFGISADKAKNRRAIARRDRLATTTELDLIGDGRTINVIIKEKETQMKQAAQELDFELAAILRDEIRELRAREKTTGVKELKKQKNNYHTGVVIGSSPSPRGS